MESSNVRRYSVMAGVAGLVVLMLHAAFTKNLGLQTVVGDVLTLLTLVLAALIAVQRKRSGEPQGALQGSIPGAVYGLVAGLASALFLPPVQFMRQQLQSVPHATPQTVNLSLSLTYSAGGRAFAVVAATVAYWLMALVVAWIAGLVTPKPREAGSGL